MLTTPASRSEISTLGGAYFSFFAIVGLMVPYLSVYLDLLGYNSSSIGIALSTVAIMRVVAPSLWSWLADKTGQHLLIARLGALLALFSLSLLFVVETREARLIVLSLFNFFWTAILPQVEVTSLRKLAATEGLYAKVRSAGSLGFIVIATLAGVFITQHGPNAFVIIGLGLSFCLFMSLLMVTAAPAISPQQSDAKEQTPLFSWPFIGLLGCCFLIQSSHGAYYTFFILHMADLGYSPFSAGWLSSIGVFAEIVLFWYIGYWFKRSTTLAIFQCALLLTVIRWLILAWFAAYWPLLVLALLLHAASFGMVHASAMRWLHEKVAHQHQAKAQALYAGMGFGAGGVVGPAIVGPLWLQGAGATQSYLACAAVAVLAILVYRLTLHSSQMA